MKKMTIMTVVGTRPEIIRLSETIKKMDIYFDHILVHTGQNWDYTLSEVFFNEFEIRKPDYNLDCNGENLGEMIGNIISKSYQIMSKVKPEGVLILGDTNSSLSAISAKRLKIPIFHMEAGNRCFDENLPEEINRRIVDRISDINLAYTEHARRYLISEGIQKEHIFVTGSPMREVLNVHLKKIQSSGILMSLKIVKGEYIVVSAHREENIDNDFNFVSLMKSINMLAEIYGKRIIFSTHPRTRKKMKNQGFEFHHLVTVMEPFGYFDYNKLQLNSFCVISDSGTLPEESAILKFPAVSIRTSTERPEAFDKGVLIIGGIKPSEIIQSVELTRKMWDNDEFVAEVDDYLDRNTSVKVVKIIQSYVKIVNKVVWNRLPH